MQLEAKGEGRCSRVSGPESEYAAFPNDETRNQETEVRFVSSWNDSDVSEASSVLGGNEPGGR